MFGAVIVLSTFAALWAESGLLLLHAPWPSLVVPIAISLAFYLYAKSRAASFPVRAPAVERRIKRLILFWSAIEGVAIFVAINIVFNLHRPDLTMAAVCLIVGLHFFPLARGMPQKSYYFPASALTMWAIVGIAASAVVTPAAIGFGAALILWLSVSELLIRARRLSSAA